ncbi:TfoX/Sxy family protein [Olivibacter sp. SDN3]|uniref:TfoX/Sxy family protein n=1 Tax=Olivibacter sp. SDN3 TaxID=2764720 RepID=UPI001651916B|nr:TfoX/Sxy family protein [Olivibacter sp. SDN3]QNL51840.1 TfoX/Sxy family protein [Olivibacter sp. SDN3]
MYDTDLADRVRAYLIGAPGLTIEEKKMFGGMAFLVNGKMCINVSGDKLMCRFDPADLSEVEKRKGYQSMVMKGKTLPGYCLVNLEGYGQPDDFSYWIELCLAFNKEVRASKDRK